MDQNSREKIKRAGFRIIRADDHPCPRIKEFKGNSAWITLANFPTKAARDRSFKDLLEQENVVED